MTTPPLFPALPGLAWPQIKKPTFSTIVPTTVTTTITAIDVFGQGVTCTPQ